MILGPAARYITGQGGYEDMAAILPGIGAANAAGKAAVGKAASQQKSTIRRILDQTRKEISNYKLVDMPGITNEQAWDIIEGGSGYGGEGFGHIIETGVSTKPYLNDAWNGSWDNVVRLIEGKKQGGKISGLFNNQEFLVNLEKCGGKMKKKACGGKMKKKK